MLVHGKDGQTHFLCYFLHRFLMHAAEDEGATALCGKRVQNRLKMAQLVTGVECIFGRIVGLKHIEFSDHFKRHDLFPPRFVDQQVARDLEEKGLPALRSGNIAIRIGTGHTLRDDIIDIVPMRQHATQPRSQRAFVRKDGLLEPIQPCPD